jgi:hypothetical protein
MRARALFSAAILSIGLGAAVTNCQVFAGLTVLEITTGTGGQGGTGGGTGGTAQGGGGSGPCIEASSCGVDTTCRTFTCDAGSCGSVDALAGKPCAEQGGQLCDGKGSCVPPSCMDGFRNGSESDVDCGGPCGKCAADKDCHNTGDCQGGLYCAKPTQPGGGGPGVCKPVRAPGDGCLGTDECGANFCTDGVCCKVAACINECWTCALSGDGTCSAHEGAPCGDTMDSECSSADTCNSLGNCQANHKDAGTICGDESDTECSAPDTCDGAGTCKDNHAPASTPCGSATSDTCTAPDTCNGAGLCLANNVVSGTACGGKCLGSTLYPAGTCASGACSAQGVSCPGGYACNAAQTACAQSCNGAAECADTHFCVGMLHTCAICGTIPPPPYSCTPGVGQCESCDGGTTCVKTCDTAGECTGGKVIGGMGMGVPPARLECNDQCDGITVTCQGPAGCEVVCGEGGCENLHLVCDLNGPCKLTCHGNSCAGATVSCGDNQCNIACDQPTAITRTCNQACSCANDGCQ